MLSSNAIETEESIKVVVRLNQAVPWMVQGQLTYADGSAVSGRDYFPSFNSFFIFPNQTEVVVNVPIAKDFQDGRDRSFTVSISGFEADAIADSISSTQTILDSKIAIPLLAKSAGTGGFHGCALTLDNKVMCWGQWGKYDEIFGYNRPTEYVQGLENIKAIEVGHSSNCAITANDTVKCWGKIKLDGPNMAGEIRRVTIAEDLSGVSNVKQLSIGEYPSCALTYDGRVYCWGPTGISGSAGYSVPTDIGLSGVIQVVAGGTHACALLADSTVRCWGSGSSGQLGNNSSRVGTDLLNCALYRDSLAPVAVHQLSGVKQLSKGGNTCAVVADGSIYCWGYNYFYMIQGVPRSQCVSNVPARDPFASSVQEIFGGEYVCYKNASNQVTCYGDKRWGFGDGVYAPFSTGTTVPVLGAMTSLTIGIHNGCGINRESKVQCWGRDFTTSDTIATPTDILIITDRFR